MGEYVDVLEAVRGSTKLLEFIFEAARIFRLNLIPSHRCLDVSVAANNLVIKRKWPQCVSLIWAPLILYSDSIKSGDVLSNELLIISMNFFNPDFGDTLTTEMPELSQSIRTHFVMELSSVCTVKHVSPNHPD